MKLVTTVTAALKTSQLICSICCSMHDNSALHTPSPFLVQMLRWQLNRPGPGLFPARKNAVLCIIYATTGWWMVEAGAEHWKPKITGTALLQWLVRCLQPLPSLQPYSHPPDTTTTAILTQRNIVPANTDSVALLIMTGHGYPDSHNCNHSAKITWGREPQQCPFYWQIRLP